MQKNKNRPDWDRIYERSKALSRTNNPIKAPLLALPYGKPPLPSKYMYCTRCTCTVPGVHVLYMNTFHEIHPLCCMPCVTCQLHVNYERKRFFFFCTA